MDICDAVVGIPPKQQIHCWQWPAEEIAITAFRGSHDLSLSAVLLLAERLGRLPRCVRIWGVATESGKSFARSRPVRPRPRNRPLIKFVECWVMHETSLIRTLIAQVGELLAPHDRPALRRVRIQIGPLSCVEPALLVSAWEQQCGSGAFPAATLEIDEVPLVACCDTCTARLPKPVHFQFRCPNCGSVETKVVSGDGVVLHSLEIEDANQGTPQSWRHHRQSRFNAAGAAASRRVPRDNVRGRYARGQPALVTGGGRRQPCWRLPRNTGAGDGEWPCWSATLPPTATHNG